MPKKIALPTNSDIALFEMLAPMLRSDLDEIRELSKKKQDGVLNQLKVKSINKKLEPIKAILSSEPTVDFLELLDESTLPTNSDAVMLMAQFVAAMDQFKKKYWGRTTVYGNSRWFTKEDPGQHYED